MLILNNEQIKHIMGISVSLDTLESGWQDLARGEAAYTPLTAIYAPCERPDGVYCAGTGAGISRALGVYALRVKSDIVYSADGQSEDKYAFSPGRYCGLIYVYRIANGEPLAILQDGYIQHLRTASTAALGAKYLARTNASSVGIIGAGGMARSYLEAFSLVRPVNSAKVYSPNRAEADSFASEMTSHLALPVKSVDSVREAVQACDIVATCTNSTQPLEIEPSWLAEGAHLTNVNPREWSAETLERCDLVVCRGRNSSNSEDLRTDHDLGYVSFALESVPEKRVPKSSANRPNPRNYPTLAQVISGKTGRTSHSQLTFFYNCEAHSLGFAALAGRVCLLARDAGIGRHIPTEWLLEDIRD